MQKLLILFLVILFTLICFLTTNISADQNINSIGIYDNDVIYRWTGTTGTCGAYLYGYREALFHPCSSGRLRFIINSGVSPGYECKEGNWIASNYPDWNTFEGSRMMDGTLTNNGENLVAWQCTNSVYAYGTIRTLMHVFNIGENFSLVGTTCGVSNVELYVLSGTYKLCVYIELDDSGDNYEFDIINQSQYKIVFSDGYEYEFICDGDKTIDYNICNYIYGYTCHIDWVRIYKDVAGVWVYEGLEPQPSFDFDDYEFMISNGESYKINFSDGHEYSFSCSGIDIIYDHDICIWVFPPSPYQPKEMIPWCIGFDNNVVLMKDTHGNFVENSQTAIYNKDTQTYIQKWRDTPEPYILLANNTDSNDEVIVMCKTFDGIFIIKTYDPIFGTDENITWCNWTIPIMYNLNLIPIDKNKNPIHDVFVSMYEYTPLNPLSFHGYDNYWGHIPVHNCSGFSRCDITSEKIGYTDYISTGLNWTSKNAMIKDYKHNINMVKTS